MTNPKLDEDTFMGLTNITHVQQHRSSDPLACVLNAG